MAVTASPPRTTTDPGSGPSRRGVVTIVVAVLLVAAAGVGWWATSGGPPAAPSASLGVVQDRVVPASVLDAPLVDQQGSPTPLSSFAGRYLVIIPFLTSCQEECPLTTAALLTLHRDLTTVGLQGSVAFAEVSVDPGRDTPVRLAAYSHLTGTSWSLLTASASTLQMVWRYFGVYYEPVPEDNPPGIDWQTGKPYTYDVNHSDGFILLDLRQHERFATVSPFDLVGRPLPSAVSKLLDDQGRTDYAHPPSSSWTVPQALQALGWLVGRTIPSAN